MKMKLNMRDQSCDDFVAKMRELLTDNAQDVIGQMESAVTEMLEPEEHECKSFHFAGRVMRDVFIFVCDDIGCEAERRVEGRELNAMYNAMLCLGLNVSTDFVAVLFERQVASMTALSSFDVDRGRFHAAAEAFRKGKGD